MTIHLHAFVSRGQHLGELLYPHLHDDGTYAVSMTRFEKDYIHITDPAELLSWLEKGYWLRMSNPEKCIRAPSLIKPQSIYRPVVI